MMKPVSATISNAAAINSAIRPKPCDVIIALTAQWNGVGPVPVSTFFILGAALPHVAPLMRATHKTAAPAMRKRKEIRQDEAASASTIVCV
jgi:hypothetical protein